MQNKENLSGPRPKEKVAPNEPTPSPTKLLEIIKSLAEKLRSEGIPVDNSCRIDINTFVGYYPLRVIERDKQRILSKENEWHPQLPKEEIEKEKLKTDGEKLELIVLIILSKFLKDNFIIVRTSLYDDYFNHIDTLIIDKISGSPICLLDEVSSIAGYEYQRKIESVLNINKKGANIKYGIRINKRKEEGLEVGLSNLTELPILYLALPPTTIKETITNLDPSIDKISEYEKKIFNYFITSFAHQLAALELKPGLPPMVKFRLKKFKDYIEYLFKMYLKTETN